ncbi:DMT family transporter [Acinetobacter pittii]|uniref:DMT family transporter n=1 Tax=Acinetobacter pittii TaxID=48296 RepID=UPI001EFDD382|nr:DMT family transporter [Acinetobacter pittii]MCG9494219.1 DMT family transporter [Acinetobacter pittii]
MIFLIFAALLWGTSFIAGKYSYDVFDPYLLVQLRMGIATLFVLPILYKRRNDVLLSFKTHKKGLLALAFLIYPATFLLQFLGLKYTSASSATTMIGIEPFMVVFMGYFFFKNKTSKMDWVLGALTFIGVLIVAWSSQQDHSINLFGCFLVIVSTIVVAIWVLTSKKILEEVDSSIFTAITILLGFILCIPFTFFFSTTSLSTISSSISISSILALLYLGIGCSYLASKLWNKGLEVSSANNGGLFLALEPIFGVIFAVLLLNENITGVTLVGVIIVLCSTFYAQAIKKS